MKNDLGYPLLPKNKYWHLITATLSSYEVKSVTIDGKVKRNIVNDNYFLANDVWNVNYIGGTPNFQEQFKKYKGNGKKIEFAIECQSVALELKYVFFHKLFNDSWTFNTSFVTNRYYLNRLTEFLNEKHPHLISLLDLDVEKAENEWIRWLNKKGMKTTRIFKQSYRGEYEGKTALANFFQYIYRVLFSLTDIRDEWEKDRWDIRVLNKKFGIPYSKSNSSYFIDFSSIKNTNFQNYLKKYIKTRLLGGKKFSWGTAQSYSYTVQRFLNFILEQQSSWNDLRGLTRKHIVEYIEYLHQYANNNKQSNSNPKHLVFNNLSRVSTFLMDIQRLEYSIASEKPISRLIFFYDYPKQDKKSDDDIDYISDYVLEQLFRNISELNPDVQPVVWVAFKTGLRIDDTLCLTQDCLVQINGKYSIVTDIEKTYVKGHKIPIDDQTANIIAVLIDKSKQKSNDDNNFDKYIFVRYRGSRKGKPFSRNWVQVQLNKLAFNRNITDEIGNIFRFKTHQFRHTYAVKMLNGGADILTVQDLLAHASPEMTLRYARLLDDTKRKAFEKVVKQGLFTFDLNGQIHQVQEAEEIPESIMDLLWKNEKLNALDNTYGSCRARINGNCPLAKEPPCLTANDGKPCFDLSVGLSDMDIKKYEIHIESTFKMIEAAKQFGREDMVEANQKNLERFQSVYDTIKTGNVIYGRFDRIRRELDRKGKARY